MCRESLDGRHDGDPNEKVSTSAEMSAKAAALRDNAEHHESRTQASPLARFYSRTGDVDIDWNQCHFKGLVIREIRKQKMFETW